MDEREFYLPIVHLKTSKLSKNANNFSFERKHVQTC